ncbi:bifunctional diguanylate cyclase/phosphodiesterase [Frigidibacter sp.]|uniref:putative bifunctional diguanylate cyclase/phosphodiesterase n=1 Tax=Frigidibacter sp. TaxID=2586418 RepID=UPI002732535D|nr:GGDEF and EAL domain-containing protein [Frigidibacter sp.]MDP3342282.1 EAL domain-containing protein [Frigidibacter sp.]
MRNFLTQEIERLQMLFRDAPGFICVLQGKQHVYELANDAYYQLIGHRPIIGGALAEVLPEVIWQGFLDKLDHVYLTGEPFVGRAIPIQLQRVAGGDLEQRYIDLTYQPLRDHDGKVIGIFAQGHDVTEAHELARKLAYQAAHDPLTGLYNRREFTNRLEALDAPGPHAILYLDIDHFKLINDRCGHAAGDVVLVQIAEALRAEVASDHLLARIGGDEFALILPACDTETAFEVAHRLRMAVQGLHPVFRGRRYSLSLSVGIAVCGQKDGLSFEAALGLADTACYLAKEKGRNRTQASSSTDEEIRLRRRDMDGATLLTEALREDRVVLHAQRIFPLQPGAQQGPIFHEVLARIQGHDGRLILPSDFIPAAERFGLVEQLDHHVIGKVFAHLQNVRQEDGDTACYFVNVSGLTLGSPEFAPFVERQLGSNPDLSASQICFEVTETAAISNIRWVCETMHKLIGAGFRFALDDFGSGMSSFAYLQDLPVHFVKIDGEFIKGTLTRPAGAAIVEAVVKVARVMNMQTIAESVEVADLLPLLRGIGIDYGQGFALQYPEPLCGFVASS